MAEAFNLLKQSIIHVEYDAVDIEEDAEKAPEPAVIDDESQPMESAAGTSSPVRVRPAAARGAAAPPAPPSSAAAPVSAPEQQPQEQARQKKRMVISHDQYINLRDMIVIHLQHHENATGRGLDREELIDWYLEERESQIHDIEELEYEKELIGKLVRKLVKVSTRTICSLSLFNVLSGKLPSRDPWRRARISSIHGHGRILSSFRRR